MSSSTAPVPVSSTDMRVVVTRPHADAERTASVLRERGHEVLVAPLMCVEPIAADLSGDWRAAIITSANAPEAIADDPSASALHELKLFAVGDRSAEAARVAGFSDVESAGGDARDLVNLIVRRHAGVTSPLLYLAGEDRAADLVGELAAYGIKVEMRVVYRAVTAPYPDELIEALSAKEIDAVLHYSRRSADNYVAGAKAANIMEAALRPRHVCLAESAAAPLVKAGAVQVAIASRPDEEALLTLLAPSRH
ncbi:uroporphyrinogen-III synthase [Microbacteriaceae bacterium K1510]|nr:uroporphyrinogen-III synthase [Microbacteriaceae bacterium K1510]